MTLAIVYSLDAYLVTKVFNLLHDFLASHCWRRERGLLGSQTRFRKQVIGYPAHVFVSDHQSGNKLVIRRIHAMQYFSLNGIDTAFGNTLSACTNELRLPSAFHVIVLL